MRRKGIILGGARAILLAVFAAGSARADVNLVSNGGFEIETPSGCQLSNGSPTCTLPPSDWSINTNGTGIAVDSAFQNSGSYDAAFGATTSDINPGILSQSIATMPGTAYALAFALLDEDGWPGDSFTVTFGGFSATINGDSALTYQNEMFPIDGSFITGSSTTLSFEGVHDPIFGADWNLDDVSLTSSNGVNAVPEPGSLLLLGTAVAGFLGLRRKKVLSKLPAPGRA